MHRLKNYSPDLPSRDALNNLAGVTLVEFGRNDCQYCQLFEPLLAEALSAYPSLVHLRLEDGKGKLLGRRLGISLWPTLILLRDGQEIARQVRPDAQALQRLLAELEH